jgi:isoleucyl-tRNA synthetase
VADTSRSADDAEPTDHIGILPSGGFVILDGKVSAELAAEGLARDVIRVVQQARKDAGLDVSDRIKLTVRANDLVLSAVGAHLELVKSETLATAFESESSEALENPVSLGDDQQVEVLVVRV